MNEEIENYLKDKSFKKGFFCNRYKVTWREASKKHKQGFNNHKDADNFFNFLMFKLKIFPVLSCLN